MAENAVEDIRKLRCGRRSGKRARKRQQYDETDSGHQQALSEPQAGVACAKKAMSPVNMGNAAGKGRISVASAAIVARGE
jgi:hypothetical protein